MNAFDLRAISSVAPLLDLQVGIYLMLFAAVIAHALVLPKMGAARLRSAVAFIAVSLLGVAAIMATLAMQPRRLHLACAAYVLVFAVAASVASRGMQHRPSIHKRIFPGAAIMLTSVVLAWWVAFAPR